MHPDAILTGLQRELDRLDPAADDYAERKAQIQREFRHIDAQPRAVVKPDDNGAIVDQDVGYLAGLKRELARAARERRDEIKAEIDRVEKLIHDKKSAGVKDAVAAEQDQSEEEPAVDADADESDQEPDAESDAEIESSDDDDATAEYFSAEFEASKSRVELDEIAASLGVENPDKLPNKGAVVDAIRAVAAEQDQ